MEGVDWDGHPRIALLRAEVASLRLERDQSAWSGTRPVLTAGVRREQGDGLAPEIDAVMVQLSLPLGRHARADARYAEVDHRLAQAEADLLALFEWDEATFLQRTEGSALRRIGHERWLRNLAIALGNGRGGEQVMAALGRRSQHPSELVREHVNWAIVQLSSRRS